MGLVRQCPKIGEGVKKGVFDAFDDVGNDGVGLRTFLAIERLNCVGGDYGLESRGKDRVRARGSRREEKEDEEEERRGDEEE